LAVKKDIVIVWQNTPCTVCCPAMDCLPHWCCWTVLPDRVIQYTFLQKWCNFTLLCAWASEGIFPRGDTSGATRKCFHAVHIADCAVNSKNAKKICCLFFKWFLCCEKHL